MQSMSYSMQQYVVQYFWLSGERVTEFGLSLASGAGELRGSAALGSGL